MKEAQATLTLSERIIKEDAYFSQRHTLSYSGLSKLSYCPSEFYKRYILQERELDTNKNQIEGKLVHCLLLNPEEFNNLLSYPVCRRVLQQLLTLPLRCPEVWHTA